MKNLFRILMFIMFICLLSIEGFFGRGYIGFGTAMLMVVVGGLAFLGCAYLGGCFEEYKGDR